MPILKSKPKYLTWIELNKKNLLHNIAQYKQIASGSEIWPVIKSNAYGHGWREILSVLNKDENVSGLAVVSLDEAVLIQKNTKKPIMVLSYFKREKKALLSANKHNISLPVYDYETIDYLDDLGKKLKKDFLINIKIDTGTNRLGFRAEESDKAIDFIRSKKNLKVFSIFTHYAESESEDLDFSREQLNTFNSIAVKLLGARVHSACSAAAISLRDAQQNLIRLGISLYGLWPSTITKERGQSQGIELKPVLSWKTRIIQIKDIKVGESVGYNRTYRCLTNAKLAILPVGYNEGYSRLLSNQSEVLIKGKRYKVRGNICMNLTMVELPEDTDIKVGEEVMLLGQDKEENISAEELAKLSQTINYEVVTKINSQLPRLLV